MFYYGNSYCRRRQQPWKCHGLRSLLHREVHSSSSKQHTLLRHHITVWADSLCIRFDDSKARIIDVPVGLSSTVALDFNCDSSLLASSHGGFHSICIWFVSNNKLMGTLHRVQDRTPWTIKFHPTNMHVLAAGYLSGTVCLWHVADNYKSRCIDTLSINNDGKPISSIEFLPRSDRIAVACGSRVFLCMFNVNGQDANAKDRNILSIDCSSSVLRCICFQPYGNLFITVGTSPTKALDTSESLLINSDDIVNIEEPPFRRQAAFDALHSRTIGRGPDVSPVRDKDFMTLSLWRCTDDVITKDMLLGHISNVIGYTGTACSFSPCGQFFAANVSDRDSSSRYSWKACHGAIVVWSAIPGTEGSVVGIYPLQRFGIITSLAFSSNSSCVLASINWKQDPSYPNTEVVILGHVSRSVVVDTLWQPAYDSTKHPREHDILPQLSYLHSILCDESEVNTMVVSSISGAVALGTDKGILHIYAHQP